MATKVKVNGKFTSRPGVYATIISGVKNQALNQSYGNILIIDDGIGSGFGGGSGINGALKQAADTIYSFESIQDFRAFVKGGELYNLAKPLFNPSGNNNGVSKIYFIQARTTTPAIMVATLTNGSFTISTKDEGVNANGVLATNNNLSNGYGAKIIAVTGGYKFQIWHGSYKGLDATNNVPYDGVLDTDAAPQLVSESPVVTAVSDLITWFTNSQDFNKGFKLEDGSTATGNIVSGDVTVGYMLAANGTEAYNSIDFDSALTVVNPLDFTHILSMKYGANATGGNNDKLFDFIKNKSKYDRLLVVAGGFDKANFDGSSGTSTNTAAYYNNDKVIVVHGGVKKKANAPSGYNVYSQLYHAAIILGRCAGLPSQVPVTLEIN
jgi:hypothetical protein